MDKSSTAKKQSWSLICTSPKEKDRKSVFFKPENETKSGFGFAVIRGDEFAGADIISGLFLKDWKTLLDKRVMRSWDIEAISDIFSDFTFDQHAE